MATNFPTSLQDLDSTRGTAGQPLSSPSHVTHHQTEDDTIEALQAKVGVDNSAVATSLDYIVKNSSSDGGGHVQTAAKGGTGQTSYTKGDLLVARNSTTLDKLAVGADGQALVADSSQTSGLKWGSALTPVVRVYTSSTTWTKPAALTYAIVEVVGAGGNGAGGSGGDDRAGGGGGGGGYSKKIIVASSLSSTEAVTVGTGGDPGGTSSFGSHCQATGGGAGTLQTTSGPAGAGAGGIGSGGDINAAGSAGQVGSNDTGGNTIFAGSGGGSVLGGGGAGSPSFDGSGSSGGVYGGGGGGGSQGGSSGGGNGGTGANGVVIVTEYYS